MHVYVTGATGYIGGHLVDRLLADGARVTALVRPTTDASRLEAKGVEVHRGSVTEPDTIRPGGCDLVVHAAAWVGFGIPKGKRDVFWATNVGGTRTVLEAARRAGVPKAVHVSSIAVLGNTEGGVANEEFQRGASYKSYYEETKLAAHRVALEYGDLGIALPMPGVVLGKGSDFDRLFRLWIHGRLPALVKRDEPTGFVHVDDVVEGILAASAKGRGPYILVDRNLRLRELFTEVGSQIGLRPPRANAPIWALRGAVGALEAVYHARGKQPPLSKELVRSLVTPMRYDASKARRELGWEPDLVRRLAAELRPGAGR